MKMKTTIFSVLFTVLIFSGCDNIKKAKNAVNAVKQAAEIAEDNVNTFKELGEDELKNVKLNEKEVSTFFKNVKNLQEKYPDIHFHIAQVAAVEALAAGENLKDIVTKEMDISYKDYTKLSSVISYVEAAGAGLKITKSMHEEMLKGKKKLETQLNEALPEEKKIEIENALNKTIEDIEDFEKEMKADTIANIRNNYELISKVKKDLDI
ncbi:MAG: hypothetical protein K9N07_05805 [Candidatus Cloacimonetes bacterium]|nr:hypothetical protein [Candidatus Cloacimonadota bacterium]